MSVYNFAVARVAALPGFGHKPSFFEATDGYMRMHTHVRPKAGPQLEPRQEEDAARQGGARPSSLAMNLEAKRRLASHSGTVQQADSRHHGRRVAVA